MTIMNIISAINTKLAGETLTYNQLRLFMDEVVDDINTDLSAQFPTFEDYNEGDEYTAFPDKYIRSVLVTGAAAKFYTMDEEGIMTAQAYQYDYRDRLFAMVRDYSALVPTEYQNIVPGSLDGPDLNQQISSSWKQWW